MLRVELAAPEHDLVTKRETLVAVPDVDVVAFGPPALTCGAYRICWVGKAVLRPEQNVKVLVGALAIGVLRRCGFLPREHVRVCVFDGLRDGCAATTPRVPRFISR